MGFCFQPGFIIRPKVGDLPLFSRPGRLTTVQAKHILQYAVPRKDCVLPKEETRMRNGCLLRVVASLTFVFLAAPLFSQTTSSPTNIQTLVLANFTEDEDIQWSVRGSHFIASQLGFPRYGYFPVGPDALYLVGPERDRSSLGINAAFNRRGFNYLEISPVETNDDGEEVESAIPIPGRASHIDVWVWGSNYDMYVDVHVRDFRGVVHVLRMGDLDFAGWRNLRTEIPSRIPQSQVTLPRFQPLELTRIVVWTRPNTVVNNFFVYFDEIRVMTDLYEAPFDGSDLANPGFVDDLWSGGNNE